VGNLLVARLGGRRPKTSGAVVEGIQKRGVGESCDGKKESGGGLRVHLKRERNLLVISGQHSDKGRARRGKLLIDGARHMVA